MSGELGLLSRSKRLWRLIARAVREGTVHTEDGRATFTPALKAGQNTAEMAARVLQAFDSWHEERHERVAEFVWGETRVIDGSVRIVKDVGRWHVRCRDCETLYVVIDGEGHGTVDGFAFGRASAAEYLKRRG